MLVMPTNGLDISELKVLMGEVEMVTAPGRCEDQVES